MNKRASSISAVIIAGIITSVIFVEGGFTNDPDDAGGKTKYGITERTARAYGYTGRIEDLTKEQATSIYEVLYVREPHFYEMVNINPAVAHKLIDAGINVGTCRVAKWFQKSLNAYSRGGADYPLIREDCSIGKSTLESYQALERIRGKVKACSLVLKALDGYQTQYYLSLTKYSKFTVGWVDKRIGNVPISQCRKYNLSIPLLGDEDENS